MLRGGGGEKQDRIALFPLAWRQSTEREEDVTRVFSSVRCLFVCALFVQMAHGGK